MNPEFIKKKALLNNIHAELLKLVGKHVRCLAIEKGKVLYSVTGKVSMSFDHRGLKRYIVSDYNGNVIPFRALQLSSIVEFGFIILVTIKVHGYIK